MKRAREVRREEEGKGERERGEKGGEHTVEKSTYSNPGGIHWQIEIPIEGIVLRFDQLLYND